MSCTSDPATPADAVATDFTLGASGQSVKSGASGRRAPLASRVMRDAVASVTPASVPSPTRHSQWERIVLNEDLELHIRRPLSRERNRLVDRLLAFVKQMNKEDAS